MIKLFKYDDRYDYNGSLKNGVFFYKPVMNYYQQLIKMLSFLSIRSILFPYYNSPSE